MAPIERQEHLTLVKRIDRDRQDETLYVERESLARQKNARVVKQLPPTQTINNAFLNYASYIICYCLAIYINN